MTRRLAWAVAATVVLVSGQAAAQSPNQESRWGVTASFIPFWKVPPSWKFNIPEDEIDLRGSEFTVGFVRGSNHGGDWGLSLVRKPFKEGSYIVRGGDVTCYGQFGCVTAGSTIVARDASLVGLEVHKFFVFATYRERLQLGMTIAAGMAKVVGTADRTSRFPIVTTDPVTGAVTGVSQGQETFVVEARQLFGHGGDYKYSPLCKLQAVLGVIVAPGLKVRLETGVNLPGYQVVGISVVYLFGVGR